MNEFANKTVYIAGGAADTGLECARRLAAEGAHVALFDQQPGRSGFWEVEVARRSSAQRVVRYPVDAGKQQRVVDAVARASAEIGPPDIVVNCFDGANGADLNGSRYLCEAVMPLLQERRSGQVVLLAPIDPGAPQGESEAGGLKPAIVDFARSLRGRLKPNGVKVLCPASKEVRLGLPLGKADSSPADAAVDNVIAAMRNHQALSHASLKRGAASWLQRVLLSLKCEAGAFRLRFR